MSQTTSETTNSEDDRELDSLVDMLVKSETPLTSFSSELCATIHPSTLDSTLTEMILKLLTDRCRQLEHTLDEGVQEEEGTAASSVPKVLDDSDMLKLKTVSESLQNIGQQFLHLHSSALKTHPETPTQQQSLNQSYREINFPTSCNLIKASENLERLFSVYQRLKLGFSRIEKIVRTIPNPSDHPEVELLSTVCKASIDNSYI
ncbi:hypothetical protein PHET_04556 [Paragonimus heterotremus]|uniref:Uncharacterized protein n=1 Tax=Paragonimus heterotremus TaxID=100268 RepID=A0A8J4T1L0_9TREM|nr:hypothetical protein PHET_04556 [Paragonimus heterotremus]